jgi:biopolymer transport protein ExbD
VIFLATLPLQQRGLDADLPSETQAAGAATPPDQIMIEYTADRRMSINHEDIAAGDLESRLRSIYNERSDKTLFIAAAGALRYGDVVEVIDAAKGAGVQRVGIVTEGMRRIARMQR